MRGSSDVRALAPASRQFGARVIAIGELDAGSL
jgi:hypothetical protein